MSRVSQIIKLLDSVFSLFITVLLLPSLEFISHAWPPIVIQKTAKQTFGEAPMTGNVRLENKDLKKFFLRNYVYSA